MTRLLRLLRSAWAAYLDAARHEHSYDPVTGECECGKAPGAW